MEIVVDDLNGLIEIYLDSVKDSSYIRKHKINPNLTKITIDARNALIRNEIGAMSLYYFRNCFLRGNAYNIVVKNVFTDQNRITFEPWVPSDVGPIFKLGSPLSELNLKYTFVLQVN